MVSSRLAACDPELYAFVQQETERQETHLELIASENYASRAVMEAQGTVLTNKYAEGYPGKRYYGGCAAVDRVETLAQQRAQQLFSAEYVNVQPHSGSQANAAVLLSLMESGETLLGMSLSEGGHLTHGSPVNFSGRIYRAVSYGIDSSGYVQYDQVRQLAHKHRPKVIIAGFSAYSRVLDWSIFREIADEVGAYLFVDMAHVAGLVAAGLYPNPLPYADVVTTTTHKTLRGPRGGMILARDAAKWAKKLNSAVFPGTQGGPLMHVIAAKAVALGEALNPEFVTYQKQVVQNARVLSEALQTAGLDIVSGGTDNHMFLVDLRKHQVTGQQIERALDDAHIAVNKNTVPQETTSPWVTSGIRIGTPAVTTRGLKEAEMRQIAEWIISIVKKPETETIKSVAEAVQRLCQSWPVYHSQ